jgi:hypothetical protein
MTAAPEAKDRRQSPTNRERRAAAHALLDRVFDMAAQTNDYCRRVMLDIEFRNGTAQVERAYWGERLG